MYVGLNLILVMLTSKISNTIIGLRFWTILYYIFYVNILFELKIRYKQLLWMKSKSYEVLVHRSNSATIDLLCHATNSFYVNKMFKMPIFSFWSTPLRTDSAAAAAEGNFTVTARYIPILSLIDISFGIYIQKLRYKSDYCQRRTPTWRGSRWPWPRYGELRQG